MISTDKYNVYTTVNNETDVLVPMNSISHVIQSKGEEIESGKTSWIHFHNGKCIHVIEEFEEVSADLKDYLDSLA